MGIIGEGLNRLHSDQQLINSLTLFTVNSPSQEGHIDVNRQTTEDVTVNHQKAKFFNATHQGPIYKRVRKNIIISLNHHHRSTRKNNRL